MTLKGIRKVEKIINDFTTKNFGVTARLDTEFEAFCDNGSGAGMDALQKLLE